MKDQEIELTEHRAMVRLPENSVEVEMICKVWHEGEMIEVSNVLGLSDIRSAFEKADNGYIDEDDRFCITEKGLAYLEDLEGKK